MKIWTGILDLYAEVEPVIIFWHSGNKWAIAKDFREIGFNGKPLFHKTFVPYHFHTGIRMGSVAHGNPVDSEKYFVHCMSKIKYEELRALILKLYQSNLINASWL